MQIMITAGTLARTRVLQLSRLQLIGALALLVALLMLLSGAIYHFVFLKAVRENWPVVSQVVRFVVRDEIAQRDRFMRANLDAMAEKVGEMQAKLVRLEAVGERVSGLAGVRPEDLRLPTGDPGAAPSPSPAAPAARSRAAGQGGPFIPSATPSFEQLDTQIRRLGDVADHQADLFILFESRLLERKLQSLLVPSTSPVTDVPPGSGFGFRTDPFTGRPALHTGLDFPADVGTPILAAAGGVVISTEPHPAYGNLVELDHGRGLITRYAHAHRVHVKAGDIVKRGQKIAEVGNTGRSTGPHLHFEVLVEGVPQNPARFLANARADALTAAAPRAASPAAAGPVEFAARPAVLPAGRPAAGGPDIGVRPPARPPARPAERSAERTGSGPPTPTVDVAPSAATAD
jgi:murein DD-endopeptidase MepM/ murein hydrolase activator NlpD